MKKVKWEMNEKFAFPDFAGMPTGAETISVTPRFTEERDEDAVRLTGIYHIAANVSFNENENETQTSEEAILIDDVDLNEQMGYFEYAVPLNIDLPAEAGNPLDVTVAKAICEVDEQGMCGISWNVECSYKETVAKVEEPKQVVEEPKQEQVVENIQATEVAVEQNEVPEVIAEAIAILNTGSFHEDDEVLSFIGELEDGVSMTLFRSNDVSMQRES